LAGLEADAAPTPTGPYQLSEKLDSQGDVITKWKTSQPPGVSGVIYFVKPSLCGSGYMPLDGVCRKTFTDETVRVGTRCVSYAKITTTQECYPAAETQDAERARAAMEALVDPNRTPLSGGSGAKTEC
jgi:hypothetical protein